MQRRHAVSVLVCLGVLSGFVSGCGGNSESETIDALSLPSTGLRTQNDKEVRPGEYLTRSSQSRCESIPGGSGQWVGRYLGRCSDSDYQAFCAYRWEGSSTPDMAALDDVTDYVVAPGFNDFILRSELPDGMNCANLADTPRGRWMAGPTFSCLRYPERNRYCTFTWAGRSQGGTWMSPDYESLMLQTSPKVLRAAPRSFAVASNACNNVLSPSYVERNPGFPGSIGCDSCTAVVVDRRAYVSLPLEYNARQFVMGASARDIRTGAIRNFAYTTDVRNNVRDFVVDLPAEPGLQFIDNTTRVYYP